MKDNVIGKFLTNRKNDLVQNLEPVTDNNWYGRAAESCEQVSDAILREKSGISGRIVKGIAGKLGFVGTTAGMFSVASLLGTASTGTAIGSLSGIAFKSAALAWIGGSVAIGSIILGVAATAGGIGALAGAGWVSKRYLWGKKRQKSELDVQEQRVLDTCLALAVAFREQEKLGRRIDPVSASAIYGDALKPLCEELLECKYKASSWPIIARRKLASAMDGLQDVTGFLYSWSKSNPNLATGIASVVMIRLLAEDLTDFNDHEMLVLDALRRSNNDLKDASVEELSTYVRKMEPSQISGLTNNVKGIYHELLFQKNENSDKDEYFVEVFEATNHPGSDVRIINRVTGDVQEVQLKATDYLSYLERHNARYSNIEAFVTDEVAQKSGNVSTNLKNADLTKEVSEVFESLDGTEIPEPIASMSVAALITLARNAKVLLKGSEMTLPEKEKLINDGIVSAGVAGLLHLVI